VLSFCLNATVKWTPYSSKQFAVRPKTSQSQHIIICFLVDQEKIWFEVTLTISHPVTSEMMFFVIIRQRLVYYQKLSPITLSFKSFNPVIL
jgi:hypothetical protein